MDLEFFCQVSLPKFVSKGCVKVYFWPDELAVGLVNLGVEVAEPGVS